MIKSSVMKVCRVLTCIKPLTNQYHNNCFTSARSPLFDTPYWKKRVAQGLTNTPVHFLNRHTLVPRPTSSPLDPSRLLGLFKDIVILKQQNCITVCLLPGKTEQRIVVLKWGLSEAEWGHCHWEYVGQRVVLSQLFQDGWSQTCWCMKTRVIVLSRTGWLWK